MMSQQPRATHNSTGTSEDVFLTLANDDSQDRRPSDAKSPKEPQRKSRLGFSSPKRFSPSKLLSRRNGSDNSKSKTIPSPSTPAKDISIDQTLRDTSMATYTPEVSAIISPGDKRSRPAYTQMHSSTSETTEHISPAYESNDEAPMPKRRRVPASANNNELGKPQILLLHPSGAANAYTLAPAFGSNRALVVPHVDGATSGSSVGAPSTVWDELDDLKSRIRKLEIGGPSSKISGADGGSFVMVDRPQTAVNTGPPSSYPSSYPTRKRAISPSAMQTESPRSYQLLQSALAKAEKQLSHEIYQALETSMTGALELASALAQGKSESSDATSFVNGGATSDRKVQRKADNLCRSLTDLCLTLCENDTNTRSVSRMSTRDDDFRDKSSSRELTHTTKQATVASSPLNYVEERRARSDRYQLRPTDQFVRAHTSGSQHESRTITRQSRADHRDDSSTRSISPPTPRAIYRTNTSNGRYDNTGDRFMSSRNNNDDDDDDLTLRSHSRAMTDIQPYTSSTTHPVYPRDYHQFSRDYTARHPMPDLAPQHNHTSSPLTSAATAAAKAMAASGPQTKTQTQSSTRNRTHTLPTSSPHIYAASEAGGSGGGGAGGGSGTKHSPSAALLLVDRIRERRQLLRGRDTAMLETDRSGPGSGPGGTGDANANANVSALPISTGKTEQTPRMRRKSVGSGGSGSIGNVGGGGGW